MNEYPLVSLIIPIYNVELYIERCLLSALNQTYQNIEIILIDDCGQDNSMSIAIKTLENHPNKHKVRILYNGYNRGPSVARNIAIESASGKYIFFLDSDDEITIDCIDILMSSCENDEIVIGSYFSEGEKNHPNVSKRFIGCEDLLIAFFKEEINLLACNKLLLKDFIISNNLFFPDMFYEDFIWTYETIKHANRVNVISKFTYKYTLRNDSRANLISRKNLVDLIKGINYIENDILKRKIDIIIYNNTYFVIFMINIWWKIKYIACKYKILSYTKFKKLYFKNKNFSTTGIGNRYKIKYYILTRIPELQFVFFNVYYIIRNIIKK